MAKLSIIDLGLIGIYFAFILYLGFKLWNNRQHDVENYLLAGRQLTLPSFIATLVSTWYGGILGVGEFSYQYGISNWLVFGVPYYLAAIIFALFIAKKARTFNLYTIPEQLERSYGKTASLIGAILVFVMTVPAAYVLMLAILLKFLFGWHLLFGLTIGTFFSTCYILIGGFNSVIRTDKLQFSLMFGGFLIMLPIVFFKYGGWGFLKANLPADHFVWHGGNGAQYIIVWYFIALATLVEPSFYQRCFAAKNEKIAKQGILYSVIFWILFDFLTTFTGLYARAILPNLADPVSAYLNLAVTVLPPVLIGLFLLGLLATIMSTIDSYSFLAAITLGRDIIWKLTNNPSEDRINYYIRWGLLLSGILAILIAFYAQSVITIWKGLGSIGTPALLLPLASSFFKNYRMQKKYAIISMVGSASLSAFWQFYKSSDGNFLFHIEPIFPGLLFSIIMFMLSYKN